MSGYAPATIEIVALGILYAAAVGLCMPFRRGVAAAKAGGAVSRSKSVLGVLSVPVAVLVLTGVLFWAGLYMTSTAGWIFSHMAHVGAWITFWLAVLVLLLRTTNPEACRLMRR